MILSNISWETYERLLADHENSSAPRFTYDQGTLEIVSPNPEHEVTNRRIAQLVLVIAEEMGIVAADFGSTTFKREDLERGFRAGLVFLHPKRRSRPRQEEARPDRGSSTRPRYQGGHIQSLSG